MRGMNLLLAGSARATTCDTSWEPFDEEYCQAVGAVPGHGQQLPQGAVVRLALSDGCETPRVLLDDYDGETELALLRHQGASGLTNHRAWAVFDATGVEPGSHDLFVVSNQLGSEHVGFEVVATGWEERPALPTIALATYERTELCETGGCCDPYTEHLYAIRWQIPAADVNGWMARLVWSESETWVAELPLLGEALSAETVLTGPDAAGERCLRADLLDPADNVAATGETVCLSKAEGEAEGGCGCGTVGAGEAPVLLLATIAALCARRAGRRTIPPSVVAPPDPR